MHILIYGITSQFWAVYRRTVHQNMKLSLLVTISNRSWRRLMDIDREMQASEL
jgi:hypothetical protein